MEFLTDGILALTWQKNCDVCRRNHPDLAGYQKGI